MVVPAEPETVAEIATRYGVDITTVRNTWTRHPDWPPAVAKRGRWKTYDPAAVDAWRHAQTTRPAPGLQPDRQYTAAEIERETGFTAANIRAALSKGRWPKPEGLDGRANTWSGRTAAEAIAARRAYTRADPAVSVDQENRRMDDKDTAAPRGRRDGAEQLAAGDEREPASTHATYRRRPRGEAGPTNPQQQAAAAWDAAEAAGYEVLGVDGARLDGATGD
jgi:hypothetical protein